MEGTNITLAELKGGAVEELFKESVRLVLANINDPNTKATQKRTITVQVEFHPNKDRSAAEINAHVKTKLAAPEPIETIMLMSAEGAELVGREPRQEVLFDKSAN